MDANGSLRKDPRALIVLIDALLLMICVSGALFLLGHDPWSKLWLFAAAPLTAMPIFVHFGLYRAVLRYLGTKAMTAVVQAVTLHALTLGAGALLVGDTSMYRILVGYWLIALVLIGGSRAILRTIFRWAARAAQPPTRVAIYGAGSAGAELAEALKSSAEYFPIAFIDDKSKLHGHEILGLRVFPTARLSDLITQYGVKEVLLAIPSVSSSRRNEITRFLERFRIHVKTVPTLSELMDGTSKLREVRELDLTDLLERDSVAPDTSLLAQCITGKSVMVTGAGGSIGSELCRQILKHKPKRLVLFERSEYALYRIEQELGSRLRANELGTDGVEILPLLGSVTDEQHLRLVMESFGVQTVYHAAAYKHVPLVEHNAVQGVANNVFGTLKCARAAIDAGVETFTLVSTDKAVRPTNVMGATKRFAELIVQSLSEQHQHTRFVVVRFGNVLGSSGSVVPLFREQIQKGGPVTITHREITRYFMTIPEAAQLVIQAAAIGAEGDVFVLDMGEPVRIIDLAHRMISLSGLTVRDEKHPRGDIAIEVTSLRPGEKLHEELVIGGAVLPTSHPRIMRVKEERIAWSRIEQALRALEEFCGEINSAAACEVLKSITGYTQGGIVDFLGVRHVEPASPLPTTNVPSAPAGRLGSVAS